MLLSAIALLLTAEAGRAADDAPPAKRIPDLEPFCRAQTVQAAVSKLSPTVTIKQLPDEEVPGAMKSSGGALFVPASKALPAYCQVSGSYVTNPKTGKTANFLATFPAAWNGKYLQMGCSGHCGQFAVSDAATTLVTITNQGEPGQIIRKGYASFATDEGHDLRLLTHH